MLDLGLQLEDWWGKRISQGNINPIIVYFISICIGKLLTILQSIDSSSFMRWTYLDLNLLYISLISISDIIIYYLNFVKKITDLVRYMVDSIEVQNERICACVYRFTPEICNIFILIFQHCAVLSINYCRLYVSLMTMYNLRLLSTVYLLQQNLQNKRRNKLHSVQNKLNLQNKELTKVYNEAMFYFLLRHLNKKFPKVIIQLLHEYIVIQDIDSLLQKKEARTHLCDCFTLNLKWMLSTYKKTIYNTDISDMTLIDRFSWAILHFCFALTQTFM